MKSYQHLQSINEELERLSAKSHRRHRELRRLNLQKRAANEVVVSLACELRDTRDELSRALLRIAELEQAAAARLTDIAADLELSLPRAAE